MPRANADRRQRGRVDRVLVLVIACGAAAAEMTVWRSTPPAPGGTLVTPPGIVLAVTVTLWVLLALPQARLMGRVLETGWRRAVTTAALGGSVLAAIGVHAAIVALLTRMWPAMWAMFDGAAGDAGIFRVIVRHDALVGVIVSLMAYALEHEYAARARREREATLRDEASRAQLQVLRMQLDPHFLFNSLNAISALVDDEPAAAQRMIYQLGGFLRQTLEHSEQAEVPMRVEVALLESYLEIERARFGERLRVEIDVDAQLADALIPMLMLQPLVENSVRHGIQPSERGGTVRVRAREESGRLRVDVTDDGVGVSRAFVGTEARGLGLRNTAERLRRSYGAAGSLDVARGEGGGTRATVVLPLRYPARTEASALA
jgi:two-component sensor histidine kinase